jgi:AcrR family transcriptional regulator
MSDPSPRRRRIGRSARRELVLEAARELFATAGYDGASMREIASRAGVTVPVVYDHFSSKAELQVHLLTQEGEELLRRVSGPFAASGPRELLDGVVEAFFSYVEQHRLVWRILFRDAPSAPEVAGVQRDLNERATAAMARFFAPYLTDDRYGMSDSGIALAEMTKSAINGLAAWWWDHPDVARRNVTAMASDMLWGGVVAVAEGPP